MTEPMPPIASAYASIIAAAPCPWCGATTGNPCELPSGIPLDIVHGARRDLAEARAASALDRLHHPGRPATPPCARCAVQRHTDADTIADLRRQVEDAEAAAAELRQRYEPAPEETP